MKNTELSYNTIGIDPGTNTGIAILVANENEIKEVKTFSIDLSKVKSDLKIERYLKLREHLLDIFKVYEPKSIAREDAFMGRFPQSFGELTRLTLVIDLAVYEYNPLLADEKYAPMVIKTFFTKNHMAKKENMREFLKAHQVLKKHYSENMTEHEVDAIAIAYLAYHNLKERNKDVLESVSRTLKV